MRFVAEDSLEQADEGRARSRGTGPELGMELRPDEVGVVLDREFEYLHAVCRAPGELEPGGLQFLEVLGVDLVAVAMPFRTGVAAVQRGRQRPRFDVGLVGAQPHRPAHVLDLVLLGQDVDDRVGRLLIEFRRVGALESEDVASVLDDRELEAQTEPQIRDIVPASVLDGVDFALGATDAKAAGDDDGVGLAHPVFVVVRHLLGVDPLDVDVDVFLQAGVFQRLVDGHVGVLEVVLAHEGNVDLALGLLGDEVPPAALPLALGEGLVSDVQSLHDVLVEALLLDYQRDVVDVVDVRVREDGVGRNVTEQRDFLLCVDVELVRTATHEHVGLETDRPELLHRVLCGLGLLLAVFRVGDERDVGKEDIVLVLLVGELAQGFQIGHPLDVPDGPPDLDDTDVVALGGLADTPLDVVGDMRDNLDGTAQVVAGAFFLDDVLVGLARGDVVVERHVDIEEPLVVPQVEVDFPAVLEHVHLAVLEGVHRPGVDVEIRVNLDRSHVEPGVFQKAAHAGGGDAFPQT